MSERKARQISYVLLCLIVLTVMFIWGNSMLNREASSGVSSAFMELIGPILEPLATALGLSMHDDWWLRKLAHFAEFGLLGVELRMLAAFRFKSGLNVMCSCAAACLAVAAVDEIIQFFSGRASRFSDVMLDFSGAVTGILAVSLLCLLLKNRFNKNEDRKSSY